MYAVAAAVMDGRLITASGRGDGTARVGSLLTELRANAPDVDFTANLSVPVFAAASTVLDGELLNVFGMESGAIMVVTLDDSLLARVSYLLPLSSLGMRTESDDNDADEDNQVSALALGVVAGQPVVVSGWLDGTIAVRGLRSDAPSFVLTGHDDAVSSLAVCEMGRAACHRFWRIGPDGPDLGPDHRRACSQPDDRPLQRCDCPGGH